MEKIKRPENYVVLEFQIHGRRSFGSIDLPESNLDSDDEIGKIGYLIGNSIEQLSLSATHAYNNLIKELEDERRKTAR